MNNGNCIVFFGGGDFGVIVFKQLLSSPFRPFLLVTAQAKPTGRGLTIKESEIVRLAKENSIAVLTPRKLDDETITAVQKIALDVGIIASYGKIIPKKLLDIFPKGIVNVHPSLLPKYRGPSPIQYAILNAENETGVTLILADEEVDHGPIIASEKLEMKNEKITYKELEKQLAETGAELLIKTLLDFLEGKIKPQEQNHSQATFTKIIKKEDGYLNFQESAEVLGRKVRAFNPWPGSYAYVDTAKFLKILRADITKEETLSEEEKGLTAGIIFTKNNRLFIRCGKEALEIIELQIEGKKPMKAIDFIHGYRRFLNKQLL